jgi:hypothetical protein
MVIKSLSSDNYLCITQGSYRGKYWYLIPNSRTCNRPFVNSRFDYKFLRFYTHIPLVADKMAPFPCRVTTVVVIEALSTVTLAPPPQPTERTHFLIIYGYLNLYDSQYNLIGNRKFTSCYTLWGK